MEKSKKLDWSKIATICLSLLLVLAMVMSITGAWFTDSDTQTSNPNQVDFGKVNIQIVDDSVQVSPATAVTNKLLPGDKFDLTGSVNTENADVDMYVYVEADVVFKIGTKEYNNLYKEAACTTSTSLVSMQELELSLDAEGWTQKAVVYTDDTKTKVKGYIYLVSADAEQVDFSGSIEISNQAGNKVYGKPVVSGVEQSAEKVVLNDTATYADVKATIQLTLNVNAIQQSNIDINEIKDVFAIDGVVDYKNIEYGALYLMQPAFIEDYSSAIPPIASNGQTYNFESMYLGCVLSNAGTIQLYWVGKQADDTYVKMTDVKAGSNITPIEGVYTTIDGEIYNSYSFYYADFVDTNNTNLVEYTLTFNADTQVYAIKSVSHDVVIGGLQKLANSCYVAVDFIFID